MLPDAFVTADASAIRAESWLLRLQGAQLVLLVAAAVVGAVGLVVDSGRLTGLLIVGCLIAVWVCRLVQRLFSFEHDWYNGRAAAESVKTLAWRYAMRVAPFDDDRTAPGRLDERVKEVTLSAGLSPDDPSPDGPSPGSPAYGSPLSAGAVVTPEMEQLRTSDLGQRSQRYLAERIDEQRQWYLAKSERFRRLALLCDCLFFVLTLGAIGAALLVAFGRSDLALIGILETAVAAILTWTGVRAYGPTATAYAFTARELQAIRALGDDAARADDTWAEFVGDAEDAISREHTMWRASRASTTTAPTR